MNAKIYNGNVQPNPKEFKIWVNDEGIIKTWNGTEWIEQSGGSGESGGSGSGSGEGTVSKIEFVDLGLPSGTLWAKANLGAISPAQEGLRYAWGELDGHVTPYGDKQYFKHDYKLYDSESGLYTKYNESDGLTSLMLEDDAAYQYDNTCKIPSIEQVQELIDNTNYEFIYIDGISCIKLTGNNDNYICLRICTAFVEGNIEAGSYAPAFYMTTALADDKKNVQCMNISSGQDIEMRYSIERYYGIAIRPVQNK